MTKSCIIKQSDEVFGKKRHKVGFFLKKNSREWGGSVTIQTAPYPHARVQMNFGEFFSRRILGSGAVRSQFKLHHTPMQEYR